MPAAALVAPAAAPPSPTSTLGANPAGTAGTANNGGSSTAAAAPITPSAGPSTGGFIQADPATNSLIITAPEPLYRQVRAMIDQLDERRAQVYIESLIVEVTGDNAADFGFQWQGLLTAGNRNNAIVGGTNFGSNGNLLDITLAQAGVAGSSSGSTGGSAVSGLSLGEGLNVGLVHNFFGTYGLAAIARLLQSQTNTNIASTPNLVTLDNEEAKIVVGSNVPFVTGQFTQTGTAATNPFQTIERKDVGITLRIRPQIGENGTIRMTIYQESSSLSSQVAPGTSNAGPSTNKRSIESNVVVDDGQILVLGGLIEDRYTDNRSKVPLLGDIPYLGALFRSESRTKTRTNLMVFLRPVVMRDADTANRLSLDRYEQIRGFQKDMQPKPSTLVPINDSPVIPPMRRIDDAGQPLAAPQSSPGTAPGAIKPKAPPGGDGAPTVNVPVIQPPAAVDPSAPPAPATSASGPGRPEETAMGARHPLPYAFAKAHTVLLEDDGSAACPVGARNGRPAGALGSAAPVRRRRLRARIRRYAGRPHRRGLRRRRVERRRGHRRGRERGRPLADDAGAAGDRRPARGEQRRADHPHAERAAHAGRQGRRERHPHRAVRAISSVRFRVDGTLREVVQPNTRAARGADLAPEDHGRARHRRAAAAAGRPHLAAHRRPRRRRARLDAAVGARRARGAAPARQGRIEVHARGPGHERRRCWRKFDHLIKQPHGIILVTGPTGSGKTTTLYASLGRVDTAGTNILTVEDPVEYELAGIGQTQVNAKIDLTFAKALRAILRQDPDVIMIGEIRDYETAQIAIQASLTGHLVLATVHTNDAPAPSRG